MALSGSGQVAALWGHLDQPLRAAQQSHPQLPFQPRHRPAKRRWRHPKPPPHLGKAAVLDHGDEGGKITRLGNSCI